MSYLDPNCHAPKNIPSEPRDQEHFESNRQPPSMENPCSSTFAIGFTATSSSAENADAPNQFPLDPGPEQMQQTYGDNFSSARPENSMEWTGGNFLAPGSDVNSDSVIEDVVQQPETKRRKRDDTEGTSQVGTGRIENTGCNTESWSSVENTPFYNPAVHNPDLSPTMPVALQQTAGTSETAISGEEFELGSARIENTGCSTEGWSLVENIPIYTPAVNNPNISPAMPMALQQTGGTTATGISGEEFSSQFPGPYQSHEAVSPQDAAAEEGYSYHYSEAVSETYPEQEERPMSSLNVDFATKPKLLATATREYSQAPENYLRGCLWSPDGSCLMTNSQDNILRFYGVDDLGEILESRTVNEMTPLRKIQETELIYDYCWNPYIRDAEDFEDCFVVTTCRDTPIHLWLCNGELQATYRAYSDVDEVTAAYSVAVSTDGRQIYSGFNKAIRIFDTTRPGRQCDKRVTYGPMMENRRGRPIKGKKKKVGQPGIISCIALHPLDESFYAAGAYSSSIGLYPREVREPCLARLQGQKGGVTHLRFSPDGTKLYSGGRMDNEIICWDVRQLNSILCVFSAERLVNTNQRIYFDLDRTGQFLVSGSCDGQVTVWDTTLTPWTSQHGPVLEPVASFGLHDDAVNGVSLHPALPLLATASGQRHFPLPTVDSSSDSDSSGEGDRRDFSVRFWKLNSQQLDSSTTEVCTEQGQLMADPSSQSDEMTFGGNDGQPGLL